MVTISFAACSGVLSWTKIIPPEAAPPTKTCVQEIHIAETKIDINSQTALSYPETRPFFNEGIDLFNTGSFGWKPKVRTVYTRSINQPILAAKVLGQKGNTQYGYLGSSDRNGAFIVPFNDFGGTTTNLGESNANIFRFQKSIFTMNRARDQNIIFRLFSVHHKIFLYAKFQSGLTPSSGFLPIDIPFLTNM